MFPFPVLWFKYPVIFFPGGIHLLMLSLPHRRRILKHSTCIEWTSPGHRFTVASFWNRITADPTRHRTILKNKKPLCIFPSNGRDYLPFNCTVMLYSHLLQHSPATPQMASAAPGRHSCPWQSDHLCTTSWWPPHVQLQLRGKQKQTYLKIPATKWWLSWASMQICPCLPHSGPINLYQP